MSTRSRASFWSNVDRKGDSECWPWKNVPRSDGYGTYGTNPARAAHRVAYELAKGPIPDGLVIDHLCRNRICVNPDHLEPVTQRTNVLRSPLTMPYVNRAKTHCPEGHPYSPENTYLRRRGGGVKRECRTCRAENQRRRRAA